MNMTNALQYVLPALVRRTAQFGGACGEGAVFITAAFLPGPAPSEVLRDE